jgi:hypothetical protein
MTRQSAIDRHLWDMFNTRLGETDKQRIDAVQSRIMARYGLRLEDARRIAQAAHEAWVKLTPTRPN